MAKAAASSEFQNSRLNAQICAVFLFCAKKGCPQKGSPCGKLSLFGVLNGATQEVFKQRIQPVPGKRIKHMIDGFGVGPAFAQNVLRNRLPLDGLSHRNKGVHLFLKPVVQQGIDVLIVIVKRIGAAPARLTRADTVILSKGISASIS